LAGCSATLAIRRTGIYFAMITLALAQMVFFLAIQIKATGGEDGLQGVPRGHLFGVVDLSDNLAMYYLVFAIFCVGFFVIYRTIHSPFGQILKAIRENEPRAISLGYDVSQIQADRLRHFRRAGRHGRGDQDPGLPARLAERRPLAHASGEVVLMTLLGGLGTILGPIVGAATIVSLQTQLADSVGSWVTVIMGVIFVICVLQLPARYRRRVAGADQALRRELRPAFSLH
jgi:branched-chain amino acid transport system permease protein